MAKTKDEKKKKTAAAPDTTGGGKGAKKLSLEIFMGDIISSKFFIRYKYLMVFAAACLIFYISFQYECKTRLETIDDLRSELARVRSECIRQQSTYHSRIRESVMQQMVDSMGLGLCVQNQPPFSIKYDEN